MPKVLVVEDDAVMRRYLVKWLVGAGYEVAEETSGAAAVVAAAAGRPGLILMDIKLDDGREAGVDATRVIRADPATAGIPVVAMSAHNMPQERDLFLAAGCVEVVEKPYTKESILAVVRAHLPGAP